MPPCTGSGLCACKYTCMSNYFSRRQRQVGARAPQLADQEGMAHQACNLAACSSSRVGVGAIGLYGGRWMAVYLHSTHWQPWLSMMLYARHLNKQQHAHGASLVPPPPPTSCARCCASTAPIMASAASSSSQGRRSHSCTYDSTSSAGAVSDTAPAVISCRRAWCRGHRDAA